MYKNSFGISKVIVKKDLYNDKKYNMKIHGDAGIGGEERNKNMFFFKLLARLDWGGLGFTTNKEYNSAFFYVKDDFCCLRDFLKRNEERYGYGNGYNETSIGGCISYDQAVFMVDSLCRQVILFSGSGSGSGSGWGFYCFLLDNVYVVDNHKFIYLGIEHMVEIKGGVGSGVDDGEKIINFTVPFPEKLQIMSGDHDTMNLFICPEIKNINQLPFRIVYSATYYHLASMIIYCMFHKNICFDGIDGLGGGLLSPIVNTKLYWFLNRCLHKDASKRILLWI